MRIVFDTNVIVAGLVAEGRCPEVIETHVPEHTPILSQTLWSELVDRLRDKFQLSIDDLPALHLYRRHAAWCEPEPLNRASAATQTRTGYWRRQDGVDLQALIKNLTALDRERARNAASRIEELGANRSKHLREELERWLGPENS